MDLMKVTSNVASRDSISTTTKNVAAKNLNGNVPMANASRKLPNVTVKPNVLMDLMKVTNNVASTNIHSTTSKDVDAQHPTGPVPMDLASQWVTTAMDQSNAKMALMSQWVKMERPSAASRNIHSTTTKNVVVKKTNGNVPTVNVSTTPLVVMVNHNVMTHLMSLTRVASTVTSSTTPSSVAVTLRLSGPAKISLASQSTNSVTVKPNVLINPMRVMTHAASRTSSSTTIRNAAASTLNSNVPMETASFSKKDVTVKSNVLINLMNF
jgi:hypothetical protein